MAVLPEDAIFLPSQIKVEQQPSKTWYLNPTTHRIQGTVEDFEAVCQAVQILLNVERFRWQIYTPYSGMQWDGLIGQDAGYVASELQRRIQETLRMDNRIRGISKFSYTVQEENLTAALQIDTVYGIVESTVEVKLA